MTWTRRCIVAATAVALMMMALGGTVRGQGQDPAPGAVRQDKAPLPTPGSGIPTSDEADPRHDIDLAMVRLPLAALLGTALALRPKRKGTPKRTPAVVQTQIILAVVGAVIMLVVGASLARAFGIVGAANLIRYRSKVDDPKDAGVMLCALAVGLASGVGLYGLSVFSTAFLVLALAIIESFEPHALKRFELTVKGKDVAELRPRMEAVLRRAHCEYEVRAAAADELSYEVRVPLDTDTDRITAALLHLTPGDETAVTWDEKKTK